jgi:hypothetical protein
MQAKDSAVDSDGNIYITCMYDGPTDLDPS